MSRSRQIGKLCLASSRWMNGTTHAAVRHHGSICPWLDAPCNTSRSRGITVAPPPGLLGCGADTGAVSTCSALSVRPSTGPDSRNWFCPPLDWSQRSSRISGPALLFTWPRLYGTAPIRLWAAPRAKAHLSGRGALPSDREVCAFRRFATNSTGSGSWHKGFASEERSVLLHTPSCPCARVQAWTVAGFQTPRTLTADREPNGNKVFSRSTFLPSVPV